MDTSPNTQPPQRTLVMGILNTTPDSFSDGGNYTQLDIALQHARQMIAAGADIIDVGGESTRPGATRVTADEECARVLPVIQELTREGIPTSIDTMRASTAAAALAAGATYINDVSGGQADPDMYRVAADTKQPIILMHWVSQTFGDAAQGDGDDQRSVTQRLSWLVEEAMRSGVEASQIILDPGLGFAKDATQNWDILHHYQDLQQLGFPLLIGASRKRFLTALRPRPNGDPGTPDSADDATAALSAIVAHLGAWGVRVHNVAPNRAAVDVAYAITTGNGPTVDTQWRAQRG